MTHDGEKSLETRRNGKEQEDGGVQAFTKLFIRSFMGQNPVGKMEKVEENYGASVG